MKKNSIASGISWKLIERFSVQVMRFGLQIVLARILDPEHYGSLTLMVVFTTLANVFIQKGFSSSLIQNKDVTEEDYSTVFWVTLGIAAVAYGIIFAAAPAISRLYGQPELVEPLRVLSLLLFPGALNSVQQSKAGREMNFRKVFVSNVGGVLVAGTVSIVLAYMGCGLWALVIQSVLSTTVSCILLRLTSGWKIRPVCNWSRVKVLFSFGWKLLVSELLDTLYQDLHSLVIGVRFDNEVLGFCNRGKQFPQFVVMASTSTVQSVMLPAMSRQQDHREQLKRLMRSTVSMSAYVIFPIMAGLAGVAEPLVKLVLTEKWLPCVPYMQIYCLAMAFLPIQAGCLQGINAVGRSDLFLQISVIKTACSLAVLVAAVAIFDSPIAIACVSLVTTLIACIINAVTCRRIVGYGYAEQLKDAAPAAVLSLLMLGAVALAGQLKLSALKLLLVQVAVGLCVYIGLSAALRLSTFRQLWQLAKQLMKKFFRSKRKLG